MSKTIRKYSYWEGQKTSSYDNSDFRRMKRELAEKRRSRKETYFEE